MVGRGGGGAYYYYYDSDSDSDDDYYYYYHYYYYSYLCDLLRPLKIVTTRMPLTCWDSYAAASLCISLCTAHGNKRKIFRRSGSETGLCKPSVSVMSTNSFGTLSPKRRFFSSFGSSERRRSKRIITQAGAGKCKGLRS